MPIKKLPKIEAWSFSRWRDYQQCPRRAKYKYIDRRKEPGSPQMERGSNIHKEAEDFTLGKLKSLPENLNRFPEEFADARVNYIEVEGQWAFDQYWNPTGWFDKDAWCRIKVDLLLIGDKPNVLRVVDHKTGRLGGDYEAQVQLYAVGALSLFENEVPGEVLVVEPELWYLDQGEIVGGKELAERTEGEVGVYDSTDINRLQKIWNDRVRVMLNDTRFPESPGNHCRWCHFSKAKGGPCRF